MKNRHRQARTYVLVWTPAPTRRTGAGRLRDTHVWIPLGPSGCSVLPARAPAHPMWSWTAGHVCTRLLYPFCLLPPSAKWTKSRNKGRPVRSLAIPSALLLLFSCWCARSAHSALSLPKRSTRVHHTHALPLHPCAPTMPLCSPVHRLGRPHTLPIVRVVAPP